ncbi:nucleolar RNA-binding protein [Trypanosoma conorhini]|uniref:Nucleolar RNA-binding protein n=1 Tax=Trypanosoma conorhini TaxID=83891 RepID=A0A3R7NS95_9TRYP|nr:nucleolar RNA-binding protein [Trypanosoma conorhini]RNF06894.1 nucleolar RNA-binding protein [Trypanosoma conorhini]
MQEFHAFEVVPGKEYTLALPPLHGFHLSVVSIPHAGKGRSTLYATVDGKSYAIATLDASQSILQNATDLIFNEAQKIVFRVKGNATLHCCGYQQELDAALQGAGDSDEEEEEDDEEGANDLPVSDEEAELRGQDPTQAPQNGHHKEESESEGSEEGEEGEAKAALDAADDEEDDEAEEEDKEDEAHDEEGEGEEQPVKRAKTEEASQAQRNSQQMQSPQGRPSNQQKQSPQGRPSNQQMQSPQGRPSNQQKQSPQGRPSNQMKRGRE